MERLAVHLPEQQGVLFRKGSETAALQEAVGKATTLTSWFALNQQNDTARQWLYADIPEHYTWQLKARQWRPRVREAVAKHVVGRLHGATPAEGERFYLYLLLLHRRGATSFEDLRTVAEKKYETFRGAAEANGLVETDEEYLLALQAASDEKMPRQFRRFFAHMLLCTEVADPLALWNRFREDLSDDFFHRLQNRDAAIDFALQDLQNVFEQARHRLRDVGIPEPVGYTDQQFAHTEMRRETLAYDVSEETREAQRMQSLMREEQAALYAAVSASISGASGKMLFVDGPG